MNEILIWLALAVVLCVTFLGVLLRRLLQNDASFSLRIDHLAEVQERIERTVRDEIARNRDELGREAREQRQELAESFRIFSESVGQRIIDAVGIQERQLSIFSEQLGAFSKLTTERLDIIRVEFANNAKELREEVIAALRGVAESNIHAISELSIAQKHQLEAMSQIISNLSDSNEKKLEAVRNTVEDKLNRLQADNAKQLEQIRQIVDEKLQGTLEKRLGESFKQVSERLELVHKGLGEMQSLAVGVGDLKKVLSNVKTRGIWGEVQLGTLLEQVLSPDQFATNVATKNTNERVEFAIKLPGQGTDKDEIVWLPIDAKFPIEDYQRLLDAQETSDVIAVENAGKQLEATVKACAADINKKYLNPPKTTDFAIMFLPIEGLFAEVIRRTGLVEAIQREYRVVVAGPTTLWSILNSLQMGFRTLAIQKRSSEVWKLLAAVKTEFKRYGELLDAVQKKLHQASDTIENAKKRSQMVGKKLKDVQELPSSEVEALLPPMETEDD